MIPNLFLHQSDTAASRLVPDDPEKLTTWIGSNVVGTLTERMDILRDSLLSLHESRLDPNRYLACMKVYREPVHGIAQEVREHNFGLSLPMPPAGVQLVNSMSNIYVQLANGYKAIVLDEADNPEPVLSTPKLATATYCALHYVSQVMHIAYEGYQPYPSGLWYEVHQLYLFARSEEVSLEPVHCLARTGDVTDNVDNAYKRILLLNLADPYQLPFRSIDKVHNFLVKWGEMAQIQTEPNDPKQRCMFLIDPEFDKPGIPLLSRTRLTGTGQVYILNTASLVSALNSLIDRTLQKNAEEWQNPRDARDGLELVDLLRTLILKWGVQPVRGKNRVETEKPCDVVTGINYVSLMVNDQVPYIADTETEQMATMLRQSSGNSGRDSLPVQPIDQPKAQRWMVIDESTAGMQLSLAKASGVQITVGELIGVRVKGESDIGWIVGVVRWAKNKPNGEARIGVLKLGWPAMPAVVRTDASNAADTEEAVALLLPGNQELNRAQSLVTPKGMFLPGNMLTVRNNDRDILARATTLIISTRAGDCFEFEIV